MEFGFGSGILTGQRTDIANATPIRFGALQDVSVEFSGDTKELFSLNQYPIDTARGKTKIMGKAKVAEIKAAMYNDLFFGQTVASGQMRYMYNETIPSTSSSYTVANAGSTPLKDQGVFDGVTGTQLQSVVSAPASGQYTFNTTTGVYSFGSSALGRPNAVNYTYTTAGGFNIAIGNPPMGTTPRFVTTLFQQFEGAQIVLVLNACVSNRLSFPTRIDDYVIQDLDFSAFADAAGNVGVWNTST